MSARQLLAQARPHDVVHLSSKLRVGLSYNKCLPPPDIPPFIEDLHHEESERPPQEEQPMNPSLEQELSSVQIEDANLVLAALDDEVSHLVNADTHTCTSTITLGGMYIPFHLM